MKAHVGNVADEDQVRKARKKAQFQAESDQADLQFLLKIPQARRFLWKLLSESNVYGSIMAEEGRIQYNSGRQDFGHFILALITEADPDAYLQMMKEARDRDLKTPHAPKQMGDT